MAHHIEPTRLLGVDHGMSVLHTAQEHKRYSAYGFDYGAMPTYSGFRGEFAERQGSLILLGQGVRGYRSSLMRFDRSDSASPFGAGGLNSYAYCEGDPVNREDPTGRAGGWILSGIRRVLRLKPTNVIKHPLKVHGGMFEISTGKLSVSRKLRRYNYRVAMVNERSKLMNSWGYTQENLTLQYMNERAVFVAQPPSYASKLNSKTNVDLNIAYIENSQKFYLDTEKLRNIAIHKAAAARYSI